MSSEKNLFVVIEGIDGSGKTTCAQFLAQKMNGIYYKTPSGIFEKMRTEVEKTKNADARFTFYLAASFFASSEISSIIQRNVVVCDRYIYSTLAYHRALGVKLSFDCEENAVLQPDFYFYLYAKEEVLQKRMNIRGNKTRQDIELEKNRKLQKKIHDEYVKFPLIQIDTSEIEPNEVCAKILSIIKRGG